MKRRTIVILAFISAVFSLVYVLLVYFGVTRFFAVHLFSTESYAKHYKALDKADEKVRVIISLTTTPERVNKLKPTLNSLLDQTAQVDEIAITVRYGCKLPESVKRVAQIYNYGSDYKDNGKLIPVLSREGEKDTKIILVDDDMVYGKDFVETLIDASNANPGKAIGVKKLGSKYGVVVTPEYFSEDVVEYDGHTRHDSWLKQHLKVPYHLVNYRETFRSL